MICIKAAILDFKMAAIANRMDRIGILVDLTISNLKYWSVVRIVSFGVWNKSFSGIYWETLRILYYLAAILVMAAMFDFKMATLSTILTTTHNRIYIDPGHARKATEITSTQNMIT